MRKVKLLALLLAALMVVTAFAGCANTKEIESDVANLDERVSALEGKIDGVGSDLSDVKDAIEADKTAEELKALQDAIKALEEKLAKQDETIKDLPTSDEGLAQAQKDAAADIAARKAVYENNKADYATKDYEAILTILEVAKTEVTAATKSADVKAIVAQMETDLAKYTAYDDQLYIYATKLLGNISAKSAELNETAQEYLKAAKKHYDDNNDATNNDLVPLTKYVYGVDEDGEDMTINLVEVLEAIDKLQTSTSKTDYQVTVEINGETTTYITLYKVTIEAAAIDNEYGRVAVKEVVDLVSENAAGALYNKYNNWLKDAERLGAENVALVTKTKEIAELANMVKNVSDAKTAYGQLGELNYSTSKYKDVLQPYFDLGANSKLIDVDDKAVKKNCYDKIDAAIAGWKTTYGFDDEFAAAVIAQYYADAAVTADDAYLKKDAVTGKALYADIYAQYVAERDYIAHMESAYTAFVKDLVPAIKEVSAMSPSLKPTEIEAYLDLKIALADWRIVVEADAENDIEEVVVDDVNFSLMLDRQNLLLDTVGEVTEGTFFNGGAAVMTNIFSFKNDVLDTTTAVEDDYVIDNFFKVTYAAAETYAEGLRKSFKTVNDNKSSYASLTKFYTVEGVYRKVKSVNTAVAEAAGYKADELAAYVNLYVDSTEFVHGGEAIFTYHKQENYTIAAFEEMYSKYGLSKLLDTVPAYTSGQKDLATFEAAKKTVEDKLAAAVADYATVLKAITSIGFQKAWTTSTSLDKYGVATTAADNSAVELKGDDVTVVYLVNLEDKAAVEAAVKARSTWEINYLGGAMKTFEPAVDANEKVIPGAYDFVEIKDADWNSALDKMALKINDLSDAADKLVAHFDALADALAFVKTTEGEPFNFVSTDLASLEKNVAVAGLTIYNNTTGSKNYRVSVLKLVDGYAAVNNKFYDSNGNPEDIDTLMGLLENVTTDSVAAILEAGYVAYRAFRAANVKYVVTPTSDTASYFKMSDYQSYAPVEDALKAVVELDLAYAQAKVINVIETATVNGEALSDVQIKTYTEQALAVSTITGLSKVLTGLYNATGASFTYPDNDAVKILNNSIKHSTAK